MFRPRMREVVYCHVSWKNMFETKAFQLSALKVCGEAQSRNKFLSLVAAH